MKSKLSRGKFFFKKLPIKPPFYALFLSAALLITQVASSQVSVVSATGGTNISADKAANSVNPSGGTFNLLGNITIREGRGARNRGNIATNVTRIVLNAPTGWVFQTSGVTASATGGDISIGTITYSSSAITIALTVSSTRGRDLLTISGVRVKASNGALLASGNITPAYTGTIKGLTAATNLGSLSQVAGNAVKLAFTQQPANVSFGSIISPNPIVRTQDQFSSNSIVGLVATVNVTIAIATGTGSLTGTVTQNIGTGGGNGTSTFSTLRATQIGTKTISASASGLTTATSNSFIISAAAPTVSITNNIITYVFTGSPQGPDAASNTGTGTSYTWSYAGTGSTTYGPSTTKPTNVGTYTATATVAANGNYASSSSAASAFSIISATPIVSITNNITPYTFRGWPQGPDEASNTGTGTSYTWSYTGTGGTTYGPSPTKPVNVGTYTARATVAANGYYLSASSTAVAFSIVAATPTVAITNNTILYTVNGSRQGPTAAFSTGTLQNFTWRYVGTGGTTYGPSTNRPSAIGTYTAQATVAASGNHTGSSSVADAFSIVTFETTADFRSKASGNLSSISTWEYFNGTSWVNATKKPGSGNNVNIRHTVTFDEAFTIGTSKTLTVAASGIAAFNNQLINVQSISTGTGSIGKVATGGQITGATNVQVERFIPISRQAWRLLTVPTTGSQTIRQAWMELGTNDAPNTNLALPYGTLITAGSSIYVGNGLMAKGGFDASSASTSIRSYNYTTGNAAFVVKNNVNSPIADTFTNGYFLFVRGNRGVSISSAPATSTVTLRSKGGINVGTVIKSLHYPGKYRLLGNPYASTIDFNNVTLSPSVTNGFYLWDASLGTTGGYSYFEDIDEDNTYNLTSGFGQYGATNSKIQSGQAFMVIATGTPGTITFTEDSKVSGSSNAGLRPASSTTAKLQAVLCNGQVVYDGASVLFASKFSNGLDKNDAVKMYNPGENLGVLRNGQSFVVESRGAVTAEEEVQYEIKNLKQQAYTIEFRATNMEGEAWLVDNYLGTKTMLNLNNAAKVSFTVSAEAKSAAADRFKVVFRPVSATVASMDVPSIKVSPNPVEGSIMNISFTRKDKGRYNLKLVDLSGRMLLNTVREHVGGNAAQQLTLPANLASGTYQLVITAPDNTKEVKKVLINK